MNYYGEHKTIHIELVNPPYGIYSWKISSENGTIETEILMQNSEFSKKLPMIISDCGENKCLIEFDFTNPE